MKKNIRSLRKNLDRVQLDLFKAQIINIYENIPFYREFFKKQKITPKDFKKIDDLKKLPIIAKEEVRDNMGMFLNKNMDLEKCFQDFTSGSTGQPFRSYFDKKSWLRKKYLSKLRARLACGMRAGEKVAVFESESVEKLELLNKKKIFRDIVLKVAYFSIFEDLEQSLSRFFVFKPVNAYGPPSFFFHLARLVKEKNISTPFLKRIFTSSEYLESASRQFIQNVFCADIFDVYGSTEFKEVSWECDQHQGYHINEDEVLCEIVKDGKPVSVGEVGDIVLTDLKNRAMPLIRYQTNDQGKMLEGRCRCGRAFSLMKPVAGRVSEYIQLPSGEKVTPFLLTTAIEKCKGLLQYQFVQKNQTDLVVNIVIKEGSGKDLISEIEAIITGITKGLMRISVQEKQKISVAENGKFMVVKNLVQKGSSSKQAPA